MRKSFSSLPAAVLAFGSLGVVTAPPSSAAAAQCPDVRSPDKVELTYATTTLRLEPGTVVCYKAATTVVTTTVPADGILVSQVFNKQGRAQDFSYYIPRGLPPLT